MYEASPVTWVVAVALAAVLALGLLVGGAAGCKAFNRYQKRADAKNSVEVTQILIQKAAQDILVAQKQNEVKHQRAIGQRKANQEIASRLTPLFVQFEMIEALKAIAASGRNNSVVYIPSGANGVPLVSVSGQPQIYGGDAVPPSGK